LEREERERERERARKKDSRRLVWREIMSEESRRHRSRETKGKTQNESKTAAHPGRWGGQ
jgi:hypothetical protein